MKKVLAIDLGSSSGKVIHGEFCNGRLEYEEIYRFENIPLQKENHLYWDFPSLLDEIKKGIHMAGEVDSIGIDTWGADFGMLDQQGNLIGNPVHYRDPRTAGMLRYVHSQIAEEQLYQMTGNQSYATNTLYQLMACKKTTPELWRRVRRILHMPDLFNYYLTGKQVCERTIASTTQMLNAGKLQWNTEILEVLGLSEDIFAPLTNSGTVIGEYEGNKIVAVAGHDTQSAGAAMTCGSDRSIFLNVGTWSLMGMDRREPLLTKEAYDLGISNEQSAFGESQYIMNMAGMWLLQECRTQWQKEGDAYSYEELETLAEKAKKNRYFIDPNADVFTLPGDMPKRIREYCSGKGQGEPQTAGEIVRCIYDSLTCKYRQELERLERGIGEKIEEIQILGGGAKSEMFCQLTADSTGRVVTAGPVEATALGNMVLQLTALGEITSREEGKKLIRKAERFHRYYPKKTADIGQGYHYFLKNI